VAARRSRRAACQGRRCLACAGLPGAGVEDSLVWRRLSVLPCLLAALLAPTACGGSRKLEPALQAVDELTVKGRAPLTGYARDRFGSGWVDVDHNGCDTRDDILRRDLHDLRLRAGTHGCVVVSGTLLDPYTGDTVAYVRGGGPSVDIDHVVALGDAWQKGAQAWSRTRRIQLADDPLNLLAVSASANRQKGDGDTATWLPANKPFRCAYVARQVAVKLTYHLWVTAAEQAAMRRVLARCPQLPLP